MFFEFIDCSLNKWSLKKSLRSLFIKILNNCVHPHAKYFCKQIFFCVHFSTCVRKLGNFLRVNRLIFFARKLKNAREKKSRAENIRVHLRFRPRAKILKTRFCKAFWKLRAKKMSTLAKFCAHANFKNA